MNMFPHSITVYSHSEDLATLSEIWNITILRGVLVDATKGANVKATGMVNADAITAYIPFDVKALDGMTGGPKIYAPPIAYHNAENRTELWTLSTDKDRTTHFFVVGEVVREGATQQEMEREFDGVYKITTVDTKDFGNLRHWEVGAR